MSQIVIKGIVNRNLSADIEVVLVGEDAEKFLALPDDSWRDEEARERLWEAFDNYEGYKKDHDSDIYEMEIQVK